MEVALLFNAGTLGMNFKFPLYAMRQYVEIHTDDKYKYITTAKNRYVLDYALIKRDSTYAERRLALLREDLPHMLYPLSVRIENISKLVTSKTRLFIDGTGKVVLWKPKTFYSVQTCKIVASWLLDNGETRFTVEGHDVAFTVRDFACARYARVVRIGRLTLLYDTSYSKPSNTRVKI